MLRQVSPERRNKPVHVICSDTLVETPMMASYVKKTVRMIEEKAKEELLPIFPHLVKPKVEHRFFYQTLGKGNPIPTPESPFSWCNDKLKRIPTQQKILELLKELPSDLNIFQQESHSLVLMLLGVRDEESARRRQSIAAHEIEGTKFGRHADYNFITCYYPIRYITSDELWFGFPEALPWGISLKELQFQYGHSFMECGIQHDSTKKKSCGSMNSRSGCWTCGMPKEDQMLLGWIAEGHEEIKHLLEWKNTLVAIRNDIRYREPERRRKYKKLDKLIARSKYQSSIFDNQPTQIILGKILPWEPGSLSIEGRKLLFRKLLYTQLVTGYELIESEEITAILNCWKDEGYSVTIDDLLPLDWKYDGSIVLYPNRDYNAKESSCKTPFYFVFRHFQDDDDLIHHLIRERVIRTGKNFYYVLVGNDTLAQTTRNTVIFYVCRPDILSQEQADRLIDDFLGDCLTFDLYTTIKKEILSVIETPTIDNMVIGDWLVELLLADLMTNGVGKGVNTVNSTMFADLIPDEKGQLVWLT